MMFENFRKASDNPEQAKISLPAGRGRGKVGTRAKTVEGVAANSFLPKRLARGLESCITSLMLILVLNESSNI